MPEGSVAGLRGGGGAALEQIDEEGLDVLPSDRVTSLDIPLSRRNATSRVVA